MLVARGTLELRGAKLRWGVGFTARLWFLAVWRSGLAIDTRFIPPGRGAAKKSTCLYHLIRGVWETHPPAAASFDGPSAFLLAREHLDGGNGTRSLTYRAAGEPYASIEVHGSIDDLGTAGSPPVPVALDARAWQSAEQVVALGLDDDQALAARLSELVDRLRELGLVSADAHEAMTRPPSLVFRALWRAFRPLVESFSTSATLRDVSTATGLSERQASRNVESFFGRFAFPGKGWRPVLRVVRLKLAVLLLSAEHATVGDVADAVGYKSVTAMAKAFRDAKLAPPSEIQDLLRAV
jgi:AraC-like DNA-binding protein